MSWCARKCFVLGMCALMYRFGKSVERGEARCLCMKSARLPLIVLIFDQVLLLCWTQVNYSVSNFRLSNGINESWRVSSTSIITTMMIDSIKHNDHWQQSRMQTYLIYARVDSFHFCPADGYAVSSLPMQRTRHRAWLRKPRRHQNLAQIKFIKNWFHGNSSVTRRV